MPVTVCPQKNSRSNPINYEDTDQQKNAKSNDVQEKRKFKDLFHDLLDQDDPNEYFIPVRKNEREFALKNPPRVLKSVIGLEDTASPWHFQINGPDKKVLDPAFPTVFIDDCYRLLDSKFLKGAISADKYTWYLMSRLLGGNAGLVRLATIYEMQKEDDGENKKRHYGFFEKHLGSDFFHAVEKKANDLVKEMVPGDETDPSVMANIVKALPALPASLRSHLCHKFQIWMDNTRDQWEKLAQRYPRL